MTDRLRDLRNGFFCCLVFLGAYLLVWPLVQMGFGDAWSYIWMARRFADTGHIAYTGWGTPMVGWMIPWGALFIKLFGFSYVTVRLSILPVAMGCLLLFHASLRRFEITPRNAVIGTLALGLSPFFLPLAASFMTDVPGLFAILLCLYLCQRAVSAVTDRAAIFWLATATVTNVVGGTARQVAWLGVLVMVPCAGWLLRKRRVVFASALVLWIAGAWGVVSLLHWFAKQPYSISAPILPKFSHSLLVVSVHFLILVVMSLAEVLCGLVIVLPLLTPWLPKFNPKGRLDHWLAFFCVGVLPLLILRLYGGAQTSLWPADFLFREFGVYKNTALSWNKLPKGTLIPYPVQLGLSAIGIAAVFGLFAAIREVWQEESSWRETQPALVVIWLLIPYSLSYVAALLLLGWHSPIYDRYLLGVLPCLIIILLLLYQRLIGARWSLTSIILLSLMSLVSVAGTHDWFAWERARLEAINELRSAGVPRDQIQGGFEYDGWTQLMEAGYVNNPKIKIPRGAFQQNVNLPELPVRCIYMYRSGFSAIPPKYSVAVLPLNCYKPTDFPSVHYTAWLPPFHRVVEVQRVPGSDGVGSLRQYGTRGGNASPQENLRER